MNSKISALLLSIVFFSFINQTFAQKQSFKVGDRVMVSPSSLKDEKYWRTGTVVEVHNFTPKKAYSVACDPQSKNDHPSTVLVNEDWVKPLTNQTIIPKNDAPKPRNNQEHPRNTTTENRNNKVACPPSDADSKGATALERSIRGAIRTGWEREPELHSDGKVTVSFQNVFVGNSHAWRQLEDPVDAKGKSIYEVRATFTTCTDYNRRIELVKRERAFACYKKDSGKWDCETVAAQNTNIKDQTRSIDKN